MRAHIIKPMGDVTIKHHIKLHVTAIWEINRLTQEDDVKQRKSEFRALEILVHKSLKVITQKTMFNGVEHRATFERATDLLTSKSPGGAPLI